MKLAQQPFLVTGAGSGLGAATALALAAQGARVALLDRDAQALDRIAAQCGENSWKLPADVTDPIQVQQAIEQAAQRLGGLRGVVQCAGVAHAARIYGRQGPMPLEEFEQVIRVNLVGTFNLMRLAVPVMAQMEPLEDGERGVLVNTASCAAFEGQIGQVAYAASKAGVVGMTLPAARELARFGIRVVTIAPGTFETPMMENMPPQVRQSLLEQIPFPPRFGQPEEFAQLALHVITNRMLNGCTLRLDGALRMGPK